MTHIYIAPFAEREQRSEVARLTALYLQRGAGIIAFALFLIWAIFTVTN